MIVANPDPVSLLSQLFPFGMDEEGYHHAVRLLRTDQPSRRLAQLLAQLSGRKIHQVYTDLYQPRQQQTGTELSGRLHRVFQRHGLEMAAVGAQQRAAEAGASALETSACSS